MHSDLEKCTHVFLHEDTTRQALEPPYQVLSWRKKTLQLVTCGRPLTLSTDRVKPAYIFNGTDCGNNTFNLPADTTLAVAPPATALHMNYTLQLPHPFPRSLRQ
jgi:hypothetical protein